MNSQMMAEACLRIVTACLTPRGRVFAFTYLPPNPFVLCKGEPIREVYEYAFSSQKKELLIDRIDLRETPIHVYCMHGDDSMQFETNAAVIHADSKIVVVGRDKTCAHQWGKYETGAIVKGEPRSGYLFCRLPLSVFAQYNGPFSLLIYR